MNRVHVKMSVEKPKAVESGYDRYETIAEFAVEAEAHSAIRVYQEALSRLTAPSYEIREMTEEEAEELRKKWGA